MAGGDEGMRHHSVIGKKNDGFYCTVWMRKDHRQTGKELYSLTAIGRSDFLRQWVFCCVYTDGPSERCAWGIWWLSMILKCFFTILFSYTSSRFSQTEPAFVINLSSLLALSTFTPLPQKHHGVIEHSQHCPADTKRPEPPLLVKPNLEDGAVWGYYKPISHNIKYSMQ